MQTKYLNCFTAIAHSLAMLGSKARSVPFLKLAAQSLYFRKTSTASSEKWFNSCTEIQVTNEKHPVDHTPQPYLP